MNFDFDYYSKSYYCFYPWTGKTQNLKIITNSNSTPAILL